MSVKSQAASAKKLFTILDWLPGYKARWLRFDILAALSVWALLVPQGIAYSSIAGVPAQYGLYAALGALIGYGIFGTSGQMVTGPSAAIAAVSASVVTLWAAAGSSRMGRVHRHACRVRGRDLRPARRAQDGMDLPFPLRCRSRRVRLWLRVWAHRGPGSQDPWPVKSERELLPGARGRGQGPRGHESPHARRGRRERPCAGRLPACSCRNCRARSSL